MNHPKAKNSQHSIHQDEAPGQSAGVKCVFVHGWGMNSAVWQPLINQLPDSVDVIAVDLAGHGQRSETPFSSLEELSQDLLSQVASQLNGPAIWVGWSLGALPVLMIAQQHPELVQKLCLLAANPCFVTATEWSYGVTPAVFDSFAENLVADTEKTLTRFLSLQVQGANEARALLRELRQLLVTRGLPSRAALTAGLDILKTADLRNMIEALAIPQLWLLGERDTLVPKDLSEYLATVDGVKSTIIHGAAHLPFISHGDQVVTLLTQFMHE